jgi:hypothetical protein
MALHRLVWLLFGFMAVSGCNAQKPAGQGAPQPVVEAVPATKATADVDRRATLALKQDLVTKFPQNSSGDRVEKGLTGEGFSCGPNPAAPAERACLKVVRETVCEINTIIRTKPYAPDKAQVIKICEVAPAKSP